MAGSVAKKKVINLAVFLWIFLLLVNPTAGFWRLLCHGTLGYGRIDPIVSPGDPSNHVHVGFGAQTFGFDNDPSNMLPANCTSCSVTQDRSLYWAPAMYFHFTDNDTYKLLTTSGGLTAYYFTNDTDTPVNITAFPAGFRMIAGDFRRRNASMCDVDKPQSNWNSTDMTQDCLSAKAIGFNCLNYNVGPEGSLEYHYLRNTSFIQQQCSDGIRAELMFPSCWDGKNLDSADHKSHIVYPPGVKTGPCPADHPVVMPVLFFEIIWNTNAFAGETGQFVLAQGDPTGYGHHGDFICGWRDNILQDAVNQCTNASGQQTDCPVFVLQADGDATQCQMDVPEQLTHEDVQVALSTLPGNVAVQSGPGYATIGPHPSAIASPSSLTASASAVSSPATTSQAISSSPIFSNVTIASTTSLSTPTVSTMADTPVFSTYTSSIVVSGMIESLVIVEEVVTVTERVQDAVKRHSHHHAHAGHRF